MDRLKLLLTPSLLSGVTCLGLTLVVLGASAWSYFEDYQVFYSYLFGAYGLKTAVLLTPHDFWTFQQRVLSSSVAYAVLIGVCAFVAGLIVYTVLEAVGRARQQADEVFHELHSRNALFRQAATETLERIGARLVAIVSWTVYAIAFVGAIVPFCLLLINRGVDDLTVHNQFGWLSVVGSVALLTLCLHIHTVFLRLCLLRARVFGAQDIEAAGGS